MLSTRSGVIAEVGGFQFDVPFPVNRWSGFPARTAQRTGLSERSPAIDVMHDVLLRSAVANDMIDPGGEMSSRSGSAGSRSRCPNSTSFSIRRSR